MQTDLRQKHNFSFFQVEEILSLGSSRGYVTVKPREWNVRAEREMRNEKGNV